MTVPQTAPDQHPPSPDPAVRVSKLGYVGFRTPDVDRLVDYYTKVLDFV